MILRKYSLLIFVILSSIFAQIEKKPSKPYVGTKSCMVYYSWDVGMIKEKLIEKQNYYTNGIIKEKLVSNGWTVQDEFSKYDSTGKLISKTIYNSIIVEDKFLNNALGYSGGDIKEIWEYSYSDEQLNSIMIRDTLGGIIRKHIFDYYSKDGYEYSEEFVYDNNDSLLQQKIVREKYNANGSLSERYHFFEFERDNEYYETFDYDTKGNLIREHHFSSTRSYGFTEYRYNPDGYLVKVMSSPGPGPQYYKRDERNRIIEIKWTDAGTNIETYIYEDY